MVIKMLRSKTDLAVALFLLAGVVLGYVVYAPGLSGTFVFDDFNNLGMLGHAGGVTDWDSLKRFLLSGFSGPTGRPVALLSFLLDANYWPADPQPFKRTNILIHLLNGVLVFALILYVLRFYENSVEPSVRAKWTALIAMLLWLCHPYLVSTNLYIVQRMAQLAATFTFSGLLVWLKGRRMVSQGKISGYLWMSFGIAFFGLLAVFSKENGALLPVLALVIEAAIIRTAASAAPLNRKWSAIFLIIPTLAIVAFLLYRGFSQGWLTDYPGRSFSPLDRVLTEARVFWIYLYHWFIPKIFTTGVYHDTFTASTGLFSPVSTIIASVALVGTLAGAWRIREHAALWSLAVLFFAVSLSIESTTIGLELLFEHRVYLGSVFLFVPILYYSMQWFNPKKVLAAALTWLVLLAFFCSRGSALWGDYPTMVMVWAEKAPNSARAQIEVVRLKYESGQHSDALKWLDQSTERIPNDFFLRMSEVLVQCRAGRVRTDDKKAALKIASNEVYSTTWLDLMRKGLEWIHNEKCEGLTPAYMLDITNNFLSQKANSRPGSKEKMQLLYIKGAALFSLERREEAHSTLEEVLSGRPTLNRKMSIASLYASYGYIEDALSIAEDVYTSLREGGLHGRALAESPKVQDVESFIKMYSVSWKNGKN